MIQSGWWFQIFLNFHPYLGKWSNLTNTVFLNHQLAIDWGSKTHGRKKSCLEFEVSGVKITDQLELFNSSLSSLLQNSTTKDILVFKYPKTRWWFQLFFMFTPIWGRFPFWLIFFKWVETTNQKKYLQPPLGLGFCSACVYSFTFPPWVAIPFSSNSDGPQDAIYQTQDEHSKGPGWGRTWKMYTQTQDLIDRYWYSFQWKLCFLQKKKTHDTCRMIGLKTGVVVDVQPLMFGSRSTQQSLSERPCCFPPGIHAVSTRRPLKSTHKTGGTLGCGCVWRMGEIWKLMDFSQDAKFWVVIVLFMYLYVFF